MNVYKASHHLCFSIVLTFLKTWTFRGVPWTLRPQWFFCHGVGSTCSHGYVLQSKVTLNFKSKVDLGNLLIWNNGIRSMWWPLPVCPILSMLSLASNNYSCNSIWLLDFNFYRLFSVSDKWNYLFRSVSNFPIATVTF